MSYFSVGPKLEEEKRQGYSLCLQPHPRKRKKCHSPCYVLKPLSLVPSRLPNGHSTSRATRSQHGLTLRFHGDTHLGHLSSSLGCRILFVLPVLARWSPPRESSLGPGSCLQLSRVSSYDSVRNSIILSHVLMLGGLMSVFSTRATRLSTAPGRTSSGHICVLSASLAPKQVSIKCCIMSGRMTF